MEPASRPCKRCGNTQPPLDNGHCPNCHSLRAGHTRNRKTPDVDRYRVEQLAAKIKSDFKPATQSLITTCEQLATVTERLEKVKPGSVEHQRLFQMWQNLTDRLESTKPEPAASSSGRAVILLPDNHREWDERVEQGEDRLREIRGEQPAPRTPPRAADPAREATPTAAPAARAAADDLDRYLVPERIVTGEGPTLKVETRMRRVTDKEIEQCLDACGDLQNYRDGKITRSKAIAWTAAWLRQQWDEREL